MLEHGEDTNVALSLAQTARRGLPNLPNSADTLGWAYYHEGAYDSAIEMLQQATKADPSDAAYHYHLALACQKSKKFALARQQFEAALKADPHYQEASEIRQQLASLPKNAN